MRRNNSQINTMQPGTNNKQEIMQHLRKIISSKPTPQYFSAFKTPDYGMYYTDDEAEAQRH
ncbi:MAG TPA: hypothetical protein PLA68_09400, partial [Panacibacter sp.]|nr:hypothetical protein [Panacibacter sp.]